MKRSHHLANRPAFFLAPHNSGMKVGVICEKCNEQMIGSDRPGLPPEVVVRHFIEKGWKVHRGGAAATCPNCQAMKPQGSAPEPSVEASLARQRDAENQRQTKKPKGKDTMTTTMSSSQNIIRAQALLHRLLGEHFTGDGTTGIYDEGWNDDRVSVDTGLHVAEVARVRDAAYGRIADPRLAKLEAAIAEEKVKTGRELHELTTMIESMKDEHAARMAAFTKQIAELQSR